MVSTFSGIVGGTNASMINIIIKAHDDFSKNINSAEKSINSLSVTSKKLLPNLTPLGASLISLGVAAGAAAIAFTALSVKSGLSIEPIRRGFEDLAQDSENFLRVLNNATEGTVSNFELMKAANNALLLGIDQKALPQMFQTAAIIGQAAGRTTTEALNDITLGIARQSRLILDNIGIIVNAEKAYRKYAETNGIVGRELTEVEKRLAFTNEAMDSAKSKAEELGGSLEHTLQFQLDQTSKKISDLTAAVGEELNPKLAQLLDGLNDISEPFVAVGKVIGDIAGFIINTLTTIIQTVDLLSKMLETFIELLALASDESITFAEAQKFIQEREKRTGALQKEVFDIPIVRGPEKMLREEALTQELSAKNVLKEISEKSITNTITLSEVSEAYNEKQKKLLEAYQEGVITQEEYIKKSLLLKENQENTTEMFEEASKILGQTTLSLSDFTKALKILNEETETKVTGKSVYKKTGILPSSQREAENIAKLESEKPGRFNPRNFDPVTGKFTSQNVTVVVNNNIESTNFVKSNSVSKAST